MRFVCSKSFLGQSIFSFSVGLVSLSLSGCVSDYQYTATSTEAQKNSNQFKTGNVGVPKIEVTPAPAGTQIDTLSVPALNKTKVDMIFIVDSSGSMEEEQDILARNFASFIDNFEQKDIDYRIAVITTDVLEPSNTAHWTGNYAGYLSPSRGNFLSRYSERFLTKDSSSITTKFKNNIQVGTDGSGREQALNSLMYALSDEKIGSGGFNAGFLRPDSLLSVVVVSDEDEDIVNEDGNSPDQRIARVEERLKVLRPANSKGFRFDFVVNLDESNPGNITYPQSTSTLNPYPNVYLKAADKFHSKKYNINADFGSDLVDIGADIVNQAEAFHKLSKLPVESSIVVKLAGVVVPKNSTNGYVYHSDTNSVELVGSTLVSSPLKQISITYQIK